MKSLMKRENVWDPFRDMEEMQNRLSRVLGLSRQRGAAEADDFLSSSNWEPAVDIIEEENEYLVKAELPEIRKEDVNVTLENGVLTITGERKFEHEEKQRKYHRMERAYGSFVRSFTLPGDANPERVNAEFKDGLLQVHIAKSESTKPKPIEIKAS
jgi:HSP20 family protein